MIEGLNRSRFKYVIYMWLWYNTSRNADKEPNPQTTLNQLYGSPLTCKLCLNATFPLQSQHILHISPKWESL